MTDRGIDTNKYFVELTDIGGGTIGYTVPFPEELLREIVKQNKQLKRFEARVKDLEERIMNHSNTVEEYCSRLTNKEQECEELKEYAQAQKNLRKTCYKEFLKKHKALEEIENYCYEQNLKYDTTACMILDIIDKAKGE